MGSTVQTLDEPRKHRMMRPADLRASGLPGLIVSRLSNMDTHTLTSTLVFTAPRAEGATAEPFPRASTRTGQGQDLRDPNYLL